MAKYDEFDLDIQRAGEAVAGGPVINSMLGTCLVNICDTTFYSLTCPQDSCMCTATQQDDCSNTCSACHSYCGGAC